MASVSRGVRIPRYAEEAVSIIWGDEGGAERYSGEDENLRRLGVEVMAVIDAESGSLGTGCLKLIDATPLVQGRIARFRSSW
jgi:hypothetical protein